MTDYCDHYEHYVIKMPATHISCGIMQYRYCAAHACPNCTPLPPEQPAPEPASAPPDPRDARIAELEATVRNQRRELNALNATERRTGNVGQSRPISQDALRLRELEAERDRLREALRRVLQDLCDLLNRNLQSDISIDESDIADAIATVRAALKGTET